MRRVTFIDKEELNKAFEDKLAEYDDKGDGKIGIEGIKKILQDVEKNETSAARYRKIAIFLSILLVILCGAVFALAFAANELSKDIKVDGDNLKDKNNKLISTGLSEKSFHLEDMFELPAYIVMDEWEQILSRKYPVGPNIRELPQSSIKWIDFILDDNDPTKLQEISYTYKFEYNNLPGTPPNYLVDTVKIRKDSFKVGKYDADISTYRVLFDGEVWKNKLAGCENQTPASCREFPVNDPCNIKCFDEMDELIDYEKYQIQQSFEQPDYSAISAVIQKLWNEAESDAEFLEGYWDHLAFHFHRFNIKQD